MQAERGIDDIRGHLAEIERPAWEIPERALPPHGFVDRAQWLGWVDWIRCAQLQEEHSVAPVHHLGDALDGCFRERLRDLAVARRRAVGRTGRNRRLKPGA